MTLKELRTETVEKVNCLVKTAEIKTAKNGSQCFSFTLTASPQDEFNHSSTSLTISLNSMFFSNLSLSPARDK